MENFKKQKTIEKERPKDELVVQHNDIIEAKYNITLQEKRLILLMSSCIKKDDKEFQIYTTSVKEICTFLQLNNKNIYKEIDDIVSKLFGRVLVVKNVAENSTTKISWLTYAKYWHGKGLVQLKFNEDLKPYMLQLKERFTMISLGDVLGLKSIYAIRLYELLKQYESIGLRIMLLSDLREYCGIVEVYYKKFNDFKRDVLERAKREINEKTDTFIDYEEIKTSRKVTSIRFSIKANSSYGKTHFEEAQSEKAAIISKELRSTSAIIEQLIEYGFTKQAANRLIKNHEEANIVNAIKAVEIYRSKHDVKNARALVETAIKEKWHPEKYKTKKRPA